MTALARRVITSIIMYHHHPRGLTAPRGSGMQQQRRQQLCAACSRLQHTHAASLPQQGWLLQARRTPATAVVAAAQACGRLPLLPPPPGARRLSATPLPSPAPTPATPPLPGFVEELSREQQEAVLSPHQHVRVIAGPGSGKTRTVAARVAWLLQQGVQPHEVLVITFTRKAAGELRERLAGVSGSMPRGLTACTFHSLCGQLMSEFSALRPYSVASKDDRVHAMLGLLRSQAADSVAGSGQAASSAADSQSENEEEVDSLAGPQRSPRATARRSSSGSTTSKSSSSKSSSSKSSSTRSRQRASSSAGSSRSAVAPSEHAASTPAGKGDKDVDDERQQADMLLNDISRMKNFVQTTYSKPGWRKTGVELLTELAELGVTGFTAMSEARARRLAYMYDAYHYVLRRLRLVDFDDMLHATLEMFKSRPELLLRLHQRWRHVLVDEGQDTNLCQFELVRHITGPGSCLFMVGDPDQAIYGFRGARSGLLQERFTQLYAGTSHTYLLPDNYRSLPAIVEVADIIRGHLRPADFLLTPGRPLRAPAGVGHATVTLLEAHDNSSEASAIVEHLQELQERGYRWKEMAVLARTRAQSRTVYRAAVAAGIPSRLALGADLWDSVEVKTVLAMLRCIVHPEAAGVGAHLRLIKADGGVKVPATTGLGATPIDALQQALEAAAAAAAPVSQLQDQRQEQQGSTPTLGACLLHGCGLGSMTPQEAADMLAAWRAACDSGSGSQEQQNAALLRFAPAWQPPQLPGLKALSKPQRTGLARLRGLVQLGAAAAMSQPPAAVLELLLAASGVQAALHAAAAGGSEEKARRASTRLANLRVLLDLAEGVAKLPSVRILSLAETEEQAVTEEADRSGGGGIDEASGAATATDTVVLLRAFLEHCSLQGDGDDMLEAPNHVSHMTIHNSKGKEWPCVVVQGVYEGNLPSNNAESPDDMEAERNALYVAATRARDQLLLSWPRLVRRLPRVVRRRRFIVVRTMVSRFLKDAVVAAERGNLAEVEVEREPEEEEEDSSSSDYGSGSQPYWNSWRTY